MRPRHAPTQARRLPQRSDPRSDDAPLPLHFRPAACPLHAHARGPPLHVSGLLMILPTPKDYAKYGNAPPPSLCLTTDSIPSSRDSPSPSRAPACADARLP
ncbi:hypothetical protein L227DRAFT_576157 [Lentinus tigrinus ALCF2SS1-6]|uniref:Uncharacterized protein n=1 Tax=Lentinus tigrinus ALCF2SS1-6 TaxID=1328759 RepID=A0A5C2S993_9APHY|nr:hypothetical protein L227DRAFT_576157 [Lentinus tigrinus ALCF2SS1-6]